MRYNFLVLFSPRRLDSLPDLPMTGDPDGYPGKDEIADYLENYARIFELPVVTGDGIEHLVSRNRRFVASTSQGAVLEATAVVVAGGAYQRPKIPDIAQGLTKNIAQFDSSTYRHPGQLLPGRVAVVGGGATGRQIFLESAASHEVWLATGRRQIITPQRLLGSDITCLFYHLGFLHADKNSFVGRLGRFRGGYLGSREDERQDRPREKFSDMRMTNEICNLKRQFQRHVYLLLRYLLGLVLLLMVIAKISSFKEIMVAIAAYVPAWPGWGIEITAIIITVFETGLGA